MKTPGYIILMATLCIVIFWFFMAIRPAPAWERDQSQSFWDRNGHFAGSSNDHGNTTTFTDRNGHFDGTVIRNSDGTTSAYDRNGHFTGSSTRTTQPR